MKEELGEAARFIELAEQEAGCRWDDPNNPAGMASLVGALARAMRDNGMGGPSPAFQQRRDDVAVGMLLMHEMSPEGQRQRETDHMLAEMLRAGIGPDTLASLFGRRGTT